MLLSPSAAIEVARSVRLETSWPYLVRKCEQTAPTSTYAGTMIDINAASLGFRANETP